MIKSILPFLLLLLPFFAAAQCNTDEYQNLLKEAKTAQKKGQYDLAINKLFSARVCRPEKDEEIKKRILEIFAEVNQQRRLAIENAKEARKQTKIAKEQQEKAEAEARRIYANDLAYKSQIALKNGDRTTAFRLAEFAHEYVEEGNPNVTIALVNALYCNASGNNMPKFPWRIRLPRQIGDIRTICFAPNSQWLAIVNSYENAIKIWDYKEDKEVRILPCPAPGVRFLSFSFDKKLLAAALQDSTVLIWNLEHLERSVPLKGHKAIVSHIYFSPDGKTLATASAEGRLMIWDTPTFRYRLSLAGHEESIESLCFSPDGERIATTSYDNTAKIWNANNGALEHTVSGQRNFRVMDIAWPQSGIMLLTHHAVFGGVEDTFKVVNLTSGKLVWSVTGRVEYGERKDACLSPDGRFLAFTENNNEVQVRDLKSSQLFMSAPIRSSDFRGLRFSPDSRKLLLYLAGSDPVIWDLETQNDIFKISEHRTSVKTVCFSPDGKMVVVGSYDNIAKILDLETGKSVREIHVPCDDNILEGIDWSPDGKMLATGCGEQVQVWDLSTGKSIMTLEGHSRYLECVRFSPDGKYLASGAADDKVIIWDLSTGKEGFSFSGHGGNVSSLSFSPKGNLLASGSSNVVIIYDIVSRKKAIEYNNNLGPNTNVFFSPNGNQLAIGSNMTAKIIDVKTGADVLVLPKHETWVSSIAFASDGRWLATGSGGTLKVWSSETGKELFSVDGHSNRIISISFSPDGKRIVSGSDDKTAKIWDLTPSGWQNSPPGKTTHLAELTWEQIDEYGLDGIFDVHPENESKFINKNEIEQTEAFAEFYKQKIEKATLPNDDDYKKCIRLYQACKTGSSQIIAKLQLEQIWQGKTLKK